MTTTPNNANAQHLHFGLSVPQQNTTYAAMRDLWHEADSEQAIDHLWLFDHFLPLGSEPDGPCFEGWTLLAAMAAETRRVRIGHLVTGNTYRHPAVLAKQAATIDHISQGRLFLGIGAGWNEREHHGYGIPLPRTAERVARLDEACELIKLLWSEPQANFAGRYYQLHEAYAEPKPLQKPYPPIVIGASGEQLMLRVVAKHAQMWNAMTYNAEEFTHKSTILDQHCAAIGRDPATIARSVIVPVESGEEGLRSTREKAQRFISAGATHIMLRLNTPYPQGIIARLAAKVITPLHASYTEQ